ncbi:MAG: hypothetical protein FJX62_24935, partial [Alphaproteobacteria bacterium]|nr:hypothetical protein [Alphaproteobacteria bacterium]
MREVDDPHDPVDQAQPHAHEAVDAPHQDAGGERLQHVLGQNQGVHSCGGPTLPRRNAVPPPTRLVPRYAGRVSHLARIPGLRILFAARPHLLTPVLRIVHRVIAGFVLSQAGLKGATADTGAVTLIQRFGSAANLNIHLHCLVLDGVVRSAGGEPVFQQARAPTGR